MALSSTRVPVCLCSYVYIVYVIRVHDLRKGINKLNTDVLSGVPPRDKQLYAAVIKRLRKINALMHL